MPKLLTGCYLQKGRRIPAPARCPAKSAGKREAARGVRGGNIECSDCVRGVARESSRYKCHRPQSRRHRCHCPPSAPRISGGWIDAVIQTVQVAAPKNHGPARLRPPVDSPRARRGLCATSYRAGPAFAWAMLFRAPGVPKISRDRHAPGGFQPISMQAAGAVPADRAASAP